MKENKKIRANLNPDVEINEKDRNCYVFRWKYIRVNPADPKHPIEKTEIRPIRQVDYHRFFEGDTAKQIKVKNVVGVDEMELVHDPTLPGKEITNFKKVEAPVEFKKVEEVKPTPITDDEKVDAAREAEHEAMKKRNSTPGSKRNRPGQKGGTK